jgi:predicted metal-dependent hydrolase
MVNHQLQLGELSIYVEQKNIKNIHLSVYPPDGRVKVSAPLSMSLDTIRVFLISKRSWIAKQQQKFQAQQRETPRDFIERESHYFKGLRYLLHVVEHSKAAKVELNHQTITLFVRPNTSLEKRQLIISEWYRQQLKAQLPKLIDKYEKLMGVKVNEFGIKKMKTKWGTCNITAGRIWLNLELMKKPEHCLEYVVVHEMVHLLERHHNARFIAYMDKFLPQWRSHKQELNQFILNHADWNY